MSKLVSSKYPDIQRHPRGSVIKGVITAVSTDRLQVNNSRVTFRKVIRMTTTTCIPWTAQPRISTTFLSEAALTLANNNMK
jgi:hypothetical protein